MKSKIHENILNQPSYWIEAFNGFLYEAIIEYMETHKLNRTQMAEYLGISKGRISQILNEGNINFSIGKIIEIALKVDKYPIIKFVNKESYLYEDTTKVKHEIYLRNFNPNQYFDISKITQKRNPAYIFMHDETSHIISFTQ